MRRVLPPLLGLLLTSTATTFAQNAGSRAEEEAQKQQHKAASLSTYKPNFIERRILEIENEGGLGHRTGPFVTFGDIKRGSGLAGGPAFGWVRPNGTKLVVKAGYSINNYKLLQVSGHPPPLLHDRLVISGRARWQDAPAVLLFPIGTDSPNVRSKYAETKREASAQALFRPVRALRFDGGVSFEGYDTGPLHSSPPDFAVPGFGVDPSYVHAHASTAIDFRDGEGYSRHGTLLRGTFHEYHQQNGDSFTFQRMDADAEQYVPILHGNWVIFLGLHASTTSTSAGQTVPFFLMPDLGGSRDLRGFIHYRFRDLHSINMTAEYRWYAQEYLDAAIFYDAGKVVPDRDSLDFSNLKHSVGAGVRLHGPQMTLVRVEVAKSNEGMRFVFAFSPVGPR